MKYSKLLTLLFFVTIHFFTIAQSNKEFGRDIVFINDEVSKLAKGQIKLFQYYVTQLTTNEGLTSAKRGEMINKCKSLFSTDAMVETMSLNKNTNSYTIGSYLNRISNPPEGVDINISFPNEINIEKVEQIPNAHNQYKVYGQFAQYYEKITATNEYHDVTIKVAIVKVEDVEENGKVIKKIKIIGIHAEDIRKY